MSRKPTEKEIQEANDRLELLFLNWSRNSFIFFTGAIALYVYSKSSKLLQIISFALSLFLISIIIVNYLNERKIITSKNIPIYTRLDLLEISLILVAIFILGIIWDIITCSHIFIHL